MIRGESPGYMRAYAGEPDLDRIIRFQAPPFQRSRTPDVGVKVTSVTRDGVADPDHALVGASVDLLGKPVFEGRNGVIAEDGEEPIFPFDLAVRRGDAWFSRATVPTDPASPYREFRAARFVPPDPGFMEAATGIASLTDAWAERLAALEADLAALPDEADARPGLEERTDFLRRNLAAGGGVARFFPVRMEWDFALRSSPDGSTGGMAGLLGSFDPTDEPWRARFWFGGWDADAQSFFAAGALEIPARDARPPVPPLRRPERMSDIVA